MIVADSIPIIRPDVLYHEVEHDVRGVLASGILTSGRHVADFEKAVADFVGVDHAVATTSATTALHLSLVALGVEQGDEVLVPDFTFPATANAVIQTGATPVFVDSGIGDFSMDPESAAMHISDRTRVIMPVDPFGQPADHLALARLADDVGARLVVDAACSLGATRDDRRCGAHGNMGCFSFHPRKVVTCGEGGLVTTDDRDLAERLRLLRNHGAAKKSTPGLEFVEPGFNYRLSEIPAVLGLSQMRRIDQILLDRRTTAHRYDGALSQVLGVSVHKTPPCATWSYQSYVVVIDSGLNRDAVIAKMAEADIETTIGTYACHQNPAYATWCQDPAEFPNSALFADQSLTLPLVPSMTTGQVERVVEALVTIVEDM